MSTFLEAYASGDPKTAILVEYTFIAQELQFCDKTDKDAFGSLTQAIKNFDIAFLCLEAVEDITGYKVADKTWPHLPKYRIEGFPKDAFHVACMSHKTRIRNILRSPGIDAIEKTLLKQRFANLSAAQKAYMKKQKETLVG